MISNLKDNKLYCGSTVLRYADAAAFLLRLGLAADKCNASNSQFKVWDFIFFLFDSCLSSSYLAVVFL